MNTKKLQMIVLIVLSMAASSILTGCATPRTKWTDKTMRIFIDPHSINADDYVRIQQALVASGKWVVVDRAFAFRAIKAELQRTHRTEADMYMDKEKYAIWGRLFGVGGVIVAHTQCQIKHGFFAGKYGHCQQFLSIVDTNTGEVIATAEGDNDSPSYEYEIAPSWEDVVADLNSAYPSHFEKNKDTEILEDYKKLSEEEAIRQKEHVVREKIASEKPAIAVPDPVKVEPDKVLPEKPVERKPADESKPHAENKEIRPELH